MSTPMTVVDHGNNNNSSSSSMSMMRVKKFFSDGIKMGIVHKEQLQSEEHKHKIFSELLVAHWRITGAKEVMVSHKFLTHNLPS